MHEHRCDIHQGAGMGSRENADRVVEALEAFNVGDFDTYLTIYEPDVVAHGFGPEPLDREGLRAFYGMVGSAFPDGVVTVEQILVDGDSVAMRYTMRGTHTGEFMGVPATDRPIEIAGQTIMRFVDGKIVERWQSIDLLTLLIQIGAVPAPAPA